MAKQQNESKRGIELGGGVTGKYLFRIREQHVAEHLIPLMRKRAVSTAKLDLVLRCVALPEEHAGAREPGTILPGYSWAQLHDLARGAGDLGSNPSDFDATSNVIRLKRKWVGVQLARLERLQLVRRLERPGRRPELIVLRDDGSGKSIDDPTGQGGDSYITILGGAIASGTLASWKTPELSAYLAAMAAERLHPYGKGQTRPEVGAGEWFRPLDWFADRKRRYQLTTRVRLPFSIATLERGIDGLENEGLISRSHIIRNPRTGNHLPRRRNFYKNAFNTLASASRP